MGSTLEIKQASCLHFMRQEEVSFRLNTYNQSAVCISWDKTMVVVQLPSCIWLFVTSWTVAHQVPRSMGFSRQEYWSGSPFPSPRDLPDLGIETGSPVLQAISCIADGFFTDWTTGEAPRHRWTTVKAFTISLVFALWNRSNNRNRVNSQFFASCKQLKVTVMARTKRGKTLFE